MKEHEIEKNECIEIINECLDSANNKDLRAILDCLEEIGFDITRPAEPIGA